MRALFITCAICIGVSVSAHGQQADFDAAAQTYINHLKKSATPAFHTSCATKTGRAVMIVGWGASTGLLLDFRGDTIVNLAAVIHKGNTFTIDPSNTQGGLYTYAMMEGRANDLAKLPFILAIPTNVSDVLHATSTYVCVDKPHAQSNSQSSINAQSDSQSVSLEDSLRQFLQTRYDKTLRYVAAFADLNGDGKPEAIVYFTSDGWCGTGGCHTLVLTQNGSSWKIVGRISVAWRPIRVLPGISHGWHSIGVWVQGGGIRPGYEAELAFDGKKYPSNPTVPPAKRLSDS